MESAERLYSIQCNGYVFDTGTLPDGRQVLVGLQMPEVVAVCFSPTGDLLDVIIHDPFHGDSEVAPAGMNAELMDIEMKLWERELGLTESTILVKKFFIPDRFIGIADLPSHYEGFLRHPDGCDDEEKRHYPEEIQQWREAGSYVLYFNEDYFMGRDGEIESS